MFHQVDQRPAVEEVPFQHLFRGPGVHLPHHDEQGTVGSERVGGEAAQLLTAGKQLLLAVRRIGKDQVHGAGLDPADEVLADRRQLHPRIRDRIRHLRRSGR